MSAFKELMQTYKKNDPAAGSSAEIVLTYPGVWAIFFHRISHFLYNKGVRVPARMLSMFARWITGIEIHPGAVIGRRLFIDHGMGIVIGETAEIGDDVKMFHAVTLGGRGDQAGKRHPTIGDGVLLSAHVQVIGNITIGKQAKIGASAVVLKDIPEGVTAVGIPAKVVKTKEENIREIADNHMM
ncbi:serine O-acetyltransferase EpsC [Alkalibacterium pelagium]|jgi:serine O-acetyltransferase|uniref:Serine acetyltransferase n=1 Tax=Alkalibacterium pelagium TaxID=426702 RepID=A0A1H7F0K9_9LACT|nr:serine O-acetyltransferase EpsC [Alkalibacterium pelagium]GEN49662.1 serine acetyltransferase [Alkalibacterium pelagium]SEK17530.1 serine O-acetyltransferase [Alkalibacterium pelagium]